MEILGNLSALRHRKLRSYFWAGQVEESCDEERVSTSCQVRFLCDYASTSRLRMGRGAAEVSSAFCPGVYDACTVTDKVGGAGGARQVVLHIEPALYGATIR
eukprot:2553533-Rhodomonas_salina.2